MPNYAELFKKDLETEIRQAREYGLELYVVRISRPGRHSFSHPDMAAKLKVRFKKVYPVAYNTVYVIVNRKEDAEKDSISELPGLDGVSVDTAVLGKDFSTLEDFLEL